MWSAATGAKSVYRFTSPTAYTAPSKDAAYRIRIKGLPGGVPDAKISSYPNPVKEIGDLLAYFKTNALIYELANVKGGSNAATYPKSAEATVVIDEDDFDKFEARMQTAIENFNEDYLENYPELFEFIKKNATDIGKPQVNSFENIGKEEICRKQY